MSSRDCCRDKGRLGRTISSCALSRLSPLPLTRRAQDLRHPPVNDAVAREDLVAEYIEHAAREVRYRNSLALLRFF